MSDDKRVIGQASVEVQELVALLATLTCGQVISYRGLSKAIGCDVLTRRHLLDSARRVAMREHRMVFGVVINEGLRRLDDEEVVVIVPEQKRKRIHNQARDGIRALSTVRYDALPTDKQVDQNVGMATLGALHIASSRKEVKRIGKEVQNGARPDLAGALRLIGWNL